MVSALALLQARGTASGAGAGMGEAFMPPPPPQLGGEKEAPGMDAREAMMKELKEKLRERRKQQNDDEMD